MHTFLPTFIRPDPRAITGCNRNGDPSMVLLDSMEYFFTLDLARALVIKDATARRKSVFLLICPARR